MGADRDEARQAKHERSGEEEFSPERAASKELSSDGNEGAKSEIPDVRLDVPQVRVEKLSIEVDHLDAHVSLNAHLAQLVQIEVGTKVTLDGVDLKMRGVDVKALLDVRLGNVRAIFDRALRALDGREDLLEEMLTGNGSPPLLNAVTDGGADRVKKLMRKTRRKISRTVTRTITAPPRKALERARDDAGDWSKKIASAARGVLPSRKKGSVEDAPPN